jgi:hypothetical protein
MQNRPLKKTFLLSASIVLIAGAALYWQRRQAPTPEIERANAPEEIAAVEAPNAERTAPVTTPNPSGPAVRPATQLSTIERSVSTQPAKPALAALPLPEATLPLAKSLTELERLANLGDVNAALRLYDEAKCCAGLPDITLSIANMAAKPRNSYEPTEARDRQSQFIQAAKDHMIALNTFCGAVPTSLPRDLARYRTLAEQSNSISMQLEFLSGESPFQPRFMQKPLRERIESLQRFERDAIPTLHRLIARGNLDAVAIIAAIHATPELHGDLGSLVKRDIYTTAVYDQLYLQAGGTAYRAQYQNFIRNRLPSQLSPEQLAQSRTEADSLHQRYFKNASTTEFGGADRIRGLQPAIDFQGSAAYPGARTCPKMQVNWGQQATPR